MKVRKLNLKIIKVWKEEIKEDNKPINEDKGTKANIKNIVQNEKGQKIKKVERKLEK